MIFYGGPTDFKTEKGVGYTFAALQTHSLKNSEMIGQMRLFKLALVSAAALFAFACGNDATLTNQPAANSRASNAAANTTAASPPTRPAATPDEFAQVRGVYSQFCQRCHKPDGTGGEQDFDGKVIKVPNLREHGLKDSDASLERHILNGGKNMPPFKDRLDPDTVKQLVRFIRAEFHGRPTAASAGGSNAAVNTDVSVNTR